MAFDRNSFTLKFSVVVISGHLIFRIKNFFVDAIVEVRKNYDVLN